MVTVNSSDAPLWQPSPEDVRRAALTRFWRLAEERAGRSFPDYAALHAWSVEDRAAFWGLYAEFAEIRFTRPSGAVKGPDRMPGTAWFPGARLNYTENLLRRRDAHPALVARTEAGQTHVLSYAQLHEQVARCARALRAAGVGPGDRVAGYLINGPEAIIGFLASAALGAIWSACSPDFGAAAAVDRLGQIEPKLLLAGDRYQYAGRRFDCLPTVRSLVDALDTLERVVVVPYDSEEEPPLEPGWLSWRDFLGAGPAGEIPYASLPFDHPLYILYSSGTTGPPKCMVHGAGGSLLQHRKEHQLHTDLRPDDVLVYFTTCGWMMWNWLVSALATGCTLVLYDGSLGYPDLGAGWRLAGELGVTAFGTSAAFVEACMRADLTPRALVDLSRLRVLLSTGSPLSPAGFRWVSERAGPHLRLSSISGGTDIVSCFVLGNPLLPVHAGEIQCLGLGMDVVALDDHGRPVVGQKGELVCRRPFPSMPVRFWNDPDGSKYQDAYFGVHPGMWHHGDFIEITPRGGVIMYGRSDATLKPGGVRIGTAEIYRPLEALPWIVGSLAAGLPRGSSEEIVLFVVLQPGEDLTMERIEEIRRVIRRDATPRHVPRHVVAVPDIPRTRNGKLAELAVSRILRGEDVPNRQALANPECLGAFEAARTTLSRSEAPQ